MSLSDAARAFERRVSREFLLVCGRDGTVRWLDERAQAALGLSSGKSLHALAAPGTEEKLRQLLATSAQGEVTEWEVSLVQKGAPTTVSFCAKAEGDEVLLLGHALPEQFANALSQVNEAMGDVVDLNRQIASQKNELSRRNVELQRLNTELSESNSGVLTLHAELADRADQLRHSADIKARLVSNVSHEFRTPLNSIVGLAQLLSDGVDGPLNSEQRKQVGFIRSSAQELAQLVDDLLDLSRAEAGKAVLRPSRFDLEEFLASLRGMLRPLAPPDGSVRFVVEEPTEPVQLETDQPKLSQILRNLISNALKFTSSGEVRVRARTSDGKVIFEVSDTGIGIRQEDLRRVFEEFAQVESARQDQVKGTGLGLPLSQSLARLLGGRIDVASEHGKGSTFTLTIPREHAEVAELNQIVERSKKQQADSTSILVVEDDRKTLFVYEKYLTMAGFHVIPARTVDDAREAVRTSRPAAIVLDVMLEGETSWSFLGELKRSPHTADIPVLVVTVTNREQKARALGADEFWLKPVDQERLLKRLSSLTSKDQRNKVLVIDDDETARYIVRKHLEGTPFHLLEAASGPEGVEVAQREHPQVILLDFLLQDITAFDVLDELKADPRTRGIPVIVVTSHVLDTIDQKRLLNDAQAIISKQNLSRELALNRIRDALRKAGISPAR